MPLIADNMPTNNLPSSGVNPNARIITSPSTPDITMDDVKNKFTGYQSEKTSVTNSPDKPYNTTEASEKTDAIYASQQGSDNKKTRGFFRKVTRLFEKTTKINPADDDDRVLIGALAVKLR
jgi:accessory colonization factor AcfC